MGDLGHPLIQPHELAARLAADPDCVAIDCRFELSAAHAGFLKYLEGHLPRARYAHLDKDLARTPAASEGRHPLPDPDDFAACLENWGISDETKIIAYDDSGGAIAARLWWLLRWLGHRRVAVLDGGIGAWTAAALPLENDIADWPCGLIRERAVRSDWVVTAAALLEQQAQGTVVVDVRAAARFRGESEPIDPVAGHIPGALNLPFAELLDSSQRFKHPVELRAVFDRHLGPAPGRPPIVAMCGSGVTACHLLLGLEVAGLESGRLYAGSWSEWIRSPARPVATGT